MRFPSDAPVTPAKREALRKRIAELGIALDRVEEHAVRSRGPGGQNVNKRATGVQLIYRYDGRSGGHPDGHEGPRLVVVKAMRERSFALNRFLALRQLAEEVACIRSPTDNPRATKMERIRKQKDRNRRRRRASAAEMRSDASSGTLAETEDKGEP